MALSSRPKVPVALVALVTFGMPFVACSDTKPPTPALPKSEVTTGFTVARNGFSFANFAGPSALSTLESNDLARMFGDAGVCAKRSAGTCIPTETAAMWQKQVNRAMSGGRCEGFAVLSGLMFLGQVPSGVSGNADASTLSLARTPSLGAELAYWFSTQFLPTVAKHGTLVLGAKEAATFLGTALERPAELYRVGLSRIDDSGRRRGGHAMLAYGVVPKGDALFDIRVYDNNHPGEERAIRVNATRDRWEYRAASNPDEPSALYEGTPENGNRLYVAPVRPRLGVQACPFCAGEAEAGEALSQIFTFGSTRATVEGSDARIVPSFSDDPLADDAPVMTLAPADTETSVVLERGAGDDDAELVVVGPGFGATLSGLTLDVGRTEAIRIGPRGASMRFEGRSGRTASTRLVRTTSRGETSATTLPRGPASGFTVAIDDVSGNVTVGGTGSPGTFDVQILRVAGDVREPFATPVDVPSSGTVTFDVGSWSGPGAPMQALVDTDGNGTIDETLTLRDPRVVEPPPLGPPRTCKELASRGPLPPSGPQPLDVDGESGPEAPFVAYCDFSTDGGGWTILASYSGADGETRITSDVEVSGDPIAFEAMNLSRAKKVALSALATESLVLRGDFAWLRANHALFDASLQGAPTHVDTPIMLHASSGEEVAAVMGWSTLNVNGGGDFGIVTSAGFSHVNDLAWHTNPGCANHYLYSASESVPDGDSGYDVQIGLGAWTATRSCNASESGHMAVYFAVR